MLRICSSSVAANPTQMGSRQRRLNQQWKRQTILQMMMLRSEVSENLRMTILSYKEAADRIAWQRELRLSALRDELLVVPTAHLRNYKPNSGTNIKHPWKDSDRHAIRA